MKISLLSERHLKYPLPFSIIFVLLSYELLTSGCSARSAGDDAAGGPWCPAQCDCFNYYETVDCSRRGLLQLPDLSNVTRRLYLEGNLLEELPADILAGAVNLSVLILENNRLIALETDAFCGLDRLQELDASNNQIRSLAIEAAPPPPTTGSPGDGGGESRWVCRAVGLKELNLAHNRLRSIPAYLSDFAPALEILNLGYNEIASATLDASYAAMTSLRYLDLSRNNIRRVFTRDLDAVRRVPLETLNLADCGLVHVDETAFRGFDNLTSLTLARSLVNQSALERLFAGF